MSNSTAGWEKTSDGLVVAPWRPTERADERIEQRGPSVDEIVANAVAAAESRAAAAAYREGVLVGQEEGREQGYAAGRRDGILEAEARLEAQYDAELARVLGSFGEAASAWLADAASFRSGLSTFLQSAALEIAEWVLGAPAAHSPEALAGRVGRLVASLGPIDGASLVVHPRDLAALQELPSWRGFKARVPNLTVETDPTMTSGTIRIATPLHHLEAHWPDRLHALREALYHET